MTVKHVDILIIGAGPSGTVAAAMARKQGLEVMIVEKQKFPRFVIGESLIPKCMENFEEAGLIDVLKAQGFQEKRGAVFLRDDRSCIIEFSGQFTKGYTWTWQMKRDKFDKVLADEVERRGVKIAYEHTVKEVDFQGTDSTTTVVDKAGQSSQIKAKFLIDASGFGRVLPRLLKLDSPSSFPVKKSVFTHIKDLRRPAGQKGTQITFVVYSDDLWLWIIPFSDGTTSLGFVGNPSSLEGLEGTPKEQFTSLLSANKNTPEWLQNPAYIFEPKTITGISYAVKQLYGDGYALTGNAAEFLDPIFSSGVAFSTESGLLAGKLAARQLLGDQVDWEQEYTSHIMQGVDVFRSYVKAWYDGALQDILFAQGGYINAEIRLQVASVLAGYVWDKENPFVKKHARILKSLAKVVQMQKIG